MRRNVVMTGTLGVMTEASLGIMKETLERKLPEVEFTFLFDETALGVRYRAG